MKDGNSGEKKIRKRKRGIYKRMVDQFEFYFSDASLRKSKHLMDLINKDPWVPLSEFEKFNRIKEFMIELESDDTVGGIVKAFQIKKSDLLELSEDNKKMRRVKPLEKNYDDEACTIYVENLPAEATHQSVKEMFEHYGSVAYVSLPKYKSSHKIKGFAFVEFHSQASLEKVLADYSPAKDDPNDSNIKPADLMSIKTFQDESKSEKRANSSKASTTKGKENDDLSANKRKFNIEDDDEDDGPKRLRIDEKEHETDEEEKCSNVQIIGLSADLDFSVEQRSELHNGGEEQLVVLTKTQWRKLRNQYLNEQRKNMAAAKKVLRRKQVERQPFTVPPAPDVEPKESVKKEEPKEEKEKRQGVKQMEFSPGLVIKITADKEIEDVKGLKKQVRDLVDGEVGYVDCRIGQTQLHVRCKTAVQAQELIKEAAERLPQWKCDLIKDEEEKDYWGKIAKDREEKRSGKVVVPKEKRKRKLIAKAESAARNTHVYFED